MVARAATSGLADAVVFDLSAAGMLQGPVQASDPAPGLDAIRQREAGAWRGPWTVRPLEGTPYLEIITPDGPVAYVNVHLAESAEFIAGARQDVLTLLVTVDRLQAESTQLGEAFARMHPQECEAGQHRSWFADAAEGLLPCPWCRIAALEAALAAPAAVFWPVRNDVPIGNPYSTREAAAAVGENEFRTSYPGVRFEWKPAVDDPAVTELISAHQGHTSATGYAVHSAPVDAGAAEDVTV